MEFNRRVSTVIFLISNAAILYLGWSAGWQVPTRANEMAVSRNPAVPVMPPGELLLQDPAALDLPSQNSRAKAYYNLGTAYYKKGNFDFAIKHLTIAIALEPKAADAYFNRGLSHRRQHRIDKAILDFSAAIRLQPGQAAYYFERCNALIVKGHFEAAVIDGSEAIRLSLDESEAYFLRGLARMLNGDLDGALKDSIQALQLDHNYADAKRLLAEVLTKKQFLK